jgi:hypothetical protein
MGRRGVNSSRGTGRGFKGENTFDVSMVAPIVLFPVSEEDNSVDKKGTEVLFICNTKDKFYLQSQYSILSWKVRTVETY